MARITHVKAARQRYATVPVIDPETGEPKTTPVMVTRTVRAADGSDQKTTVQKTTKTGKPVVMKLTTTDKTRPLPNYTCEACRSEITVGSPYKHVSPKSGPYGGVTRRRCAQCPTWEPWELSNALWARVAQVMTPAEESFASARKDQDADGMRTALETAAGGIRQLAEERAESAQSIEDGFGHETEQSMKLQEDASNLESWADEMESAEVLDYPTDPEGKVPCEECDGDGTDAEDEECTGCGGDGEVDATEVTEDQISEWEDQIEEAATTLENNPL